jgi:hypothetical protein
VKRALIAAVCLALGAGTAHAQMTRAIDKARNAKKAADTHVANEQNTDGATAGQTQKKAAAGSPQAKASTATTAKPGSMGGPAGTAPAKLDTVPSFVMREAFDYDRAGTRDPFASLLNTSDLRPAISDLRLIGILYDQSGSRSVAIMRDQQNTLYRSMVGQTLGRMRVSRITPRAVIFTIEEFGMNRQDSLVLVDTTKTRIP